MTEQPVQDPRNDDAAAAASRSDSAARTPLPPATSIGRIPVVKVSPVIEDGTHPAKATVGEEFPIRATYFREGHDAVAGTAVLTAPDGTQHTWEMTPCEPKGWNRYEAWVSCDTEGPWTFRVEAWDDPWETWHHNAEVKLAAGMDVALMLMEGRALFNEAADAADPISQDDAAALRRLAQLSDPDTADTPDPERDAEILGAAARELMAQHRPRRLVSPTREYPLYCDRQRALFGAWYEFFPRSQGAYRDENGQWVSGTFDSSHERLEAAAAMGFDVVYLPPIHPIGDAFRKGPNNTLTPEPGDPGSPWAIGNTTGGHDAIHPELGDFDAFGRFVARAHELGMEVALDFALQASPDHPWVTEHPEWFSERLDGTIAYAENPPKKYQDIYPINFDRDPQGIYAESLRLINFWIDRGVTIFRVDNPHTKPFEFWQWLLAEVRKNHPEVIFLAEAFTNPERMHTLGKVGFQQSYTYFTWRNEKWEIEEYLGELSTEMDSFYRPNFFVNTPDINPRFLQTSGPAGFAIRAVLASTLSPTWGVYSGFELFEGDPLKIGGEEYLDSEKYEFRPRDWSGGARGNLNGFIGLLNRLRRENPALQQLRHIDFHHVPHDQVIAYSKRSSSAEDANIVFVVCSLDPHNPVESEVYIDHEALGVPQDAVLEMHDMVTGAEYRWGPRNYVRLEPSNPAHIFTVRIG